MMGYSLSDILDEFKKLEDNENSVWTILLLLLLFTTGGFKLSEDKDNKNENDATNL